MKAIQRFGPAAVDMYPALRKMLASRLGNEWIWLSHALASMGEKSASAIADVVAALNEPSLCGAAAYTLSLWGPAAISAAPRLIKFLERGRGEEWSRVNAVNALGDIGSRDSATQTVLKKLLRDPSAEVRAVAAAALWRIEPVVELALPVIEEILRDAKAQTARSHGITKALEALQLVGPAGKALAPLAASLLNSSDQWVRTHAALALHRMGESLEVFLPTLIEELRCRPVGFLALGCIADIGAPAVAAVPRLDELSNFEVGLSEGGLADELASRKRSSAMRLPKRCGQFVLGSRFLREQSCGCRRST